MPSTVRERIRSDSNSGHQGEHPEKHFTNRVPRVVNAPTDAELDPLAGELRGDVVQVAGRATEPVQLGHHQDVPVPDRTQRRGEPRPLPVASGPAPIGVQMLVGDPELFQGGELRTHILARCGASGVPDEDFGHQRSPVLVKPALPNSLPRRSTRTAHAGRSRPPKWVRNRPVERSSYRTSAEAARHPHISHPRPSPSAQRSREHDGG